MALREADLHDFVMGFVAKSREYKSEFVEIWQESLANFVVNAEDIEDRTVGRPYRNNHSYLSRGIVLKDGETHKALTTLASKLVLSTLGDPRGEYVRARPVGYEDAMAGKSQTVTRLMRYAFSLPGSFRTMVEAVIEMLIFGTAVLEIPWRYQEREQPIREVESVAGIEIDITRPGRVVSYNDVEINVVDAADFFPDPSEYRIEKMAGVAKKFTINAMRARELADQGIYRTKAVETAIKQSGESRSGHPQDDFREGVDQPDIRDSAREFASMTGYEYWGEVPGPLIERRESDERITSRRVVTVLEGVIVRDIEYPYADTDLPFRTLTILPMVGRFYGISAAEVMRYDQDLQDAARILLAEAIVRQVHPPIAFDIDTEIDEDRLREWSPDVPIPIRGGPSSIGTVKYEAGVFNGLALTNQLKQSMQETSGALAPIQGQGLGINRASATEAQLTFEQALSRPELSAALLEREDLPKIAQSILRRYQQFEDSEGLALKVGQLPQPFWIGDIMGDFDIQFVGSRQAMSRQQKLQAYQMLISLAGVVPGAAQLIPWQQMFSEIVGNVLELPEIAGMIGSPEQVQLNLMLSQMTQGQGSGNGNLAAPRAEPPGTLPAQAAGNINA